MGSVYSGYPNGHVGQIDQAFAAKEDIIPLIRKKDNIVDYKGLLKLGIQAEPNTIMYLNGQRIRIGKTGIYELDYTVAIKSLYFEADTTALIDYVW